MASRRSNAARTACGQLEISDVALHNELQVGLVVHRNRRSLSAESSFRWWFGAPVQAGEAGRPQRSVRTKIVPAENPLSASQYLSGDAALLMARHLDNQQ